jgi:hypothetical protein
VGQCSVAIWVLVEQAASTARHTSLPAGVYVGCISNEWPKWWPNYSSYAWDITVYLHGTEKEIREMAIPRDQAAHTCSLREIDWKALQLTRTSPAHRMMLGAHHE